MNDEQLIAAARDAVRVIVRRPHAYKFRAEYERAIIPGLTVLDAEGRFVGATGLPSPGAAAKVIELLHR